MNNKNLFLIGLLIVIAVAVYFIFSSKDSDTLTVEQEDVETPSGSITPSLSSDKKSIVADGKVLLSVDDEAIIEFFRSDKSAMCDDSNIDNTPTRRSFCTDKNVFREKVVFTKIVPSSTGNKIGFVIETEELSPDTVSGVFYPKNTTYQVHLLTTYYLGNDFIGFSPADTYLVTKDSCFEGVCGFTVMDAATLETIKHFGNPETEPAYTFVRWVTDGKIEYRVGDELKQASL
jgi:hypothetical protein